VLGRERVRNQKILSVGDPAPRQEGPNRINRRWKVALQKTLKSEGLGRKNRPSVTILKGPRKVEKK